MESSLDVYQTLRQHIVFTPIPLTLGQYEWCVDCLEPQLWVRYKDENQEDVCGAMGISANISDEEIIDNLVAYGKEHGLDVMG